MEPAAEGTSVIGVLHAHANPAAAHLLALFGWSRGKTNRRGMEQTLAAIKAEVEADA